MEQLSPFPPPPQSNDEGAKEQKRAILTYILIHTYIHTLFGVLYIVHRQCPNKFTIY